MPVRNATLVILFLLLVTLVNYWISTSFELWYSVIYQPHNERWIILSKSARCVSRIYSGIIRYHTHLIINIRDSHFYVCNMVETKNCWIPYIEILFGNLWGYRTSIPATFGSDFIAPCTYYPSVTMILFIDG